VSLSPQQARVFGLTEQGFTPDEIAEQLGVKRHAVTSCLYKARRALAPEPVPCELCGEDPAMTAGLCGFCYEEMNAA
jgi:hypothetical protein